MSSTLADLQRRNIEKMSTKEAEQPSIVSEDHSSDTDASQSALTEVRTPVSTQASTGISEEGSTEVIPEVRTDGRKEASTGGRKHGRQRAEADAARVGFLEAVEAALASREPLTGGVKATVDMSPDLSTRAKRYLADHRGQNTRQVLIALFDAFLSAKGY